MAKHLILLRHPPKISIQTYHLLEGQLVVNYLVVRLCNHQVILTEGTVI